MKKQVEKLSVVNPRSAGIDVGSRTHMVAIGQNAEDVREFGVYSENLENLCHWLTENKIYSVAMESTGSYWKVLFDTLQAKGFEVMLVNGQQTKNVKGRKTDIQDCQWIQKLHSLGLLSGSFLPDHFTEQLRTYFRHRQYLLEQAADYIKKMQKSLRLLNIRLDIAINDISGHSGQDITRAILNGERDAGVLASLANFRIKKSKEELKRALTGNWRNDHLYELKDSFEMYHIFHAKVDDCDREIEQFIQQELGSKDVYGMNELNVRTKKKANKNSPKFDVRTLGYYLHNGVDIMEIEGVSHSTLLCFMAEVGNNINKFPTANQFASWLRLHPNRKVSGGKVLSSRTPKGSNLFSSALKRAANVIGNLNEGALSLFFKRIAYRKGRMAAITATARKLSVIIWNMMVKKSCYAPIETENYQKQVRLKQIKILEQKIRKMEIKPHEINFAIT
jgi:transposase